MVKQLQDEQSSLDEEARNRLWDNGKQAENVFMSQLHFFLIFESLLLGSVVSGLLTNQHFDGKPALLGIAIFGCIVTLFWLCIQYSQGYLFEKVKARVEEHLPEYKETLKQRRGGEEKPQELPYKLLELANNLKFQAISIPGLVALAWLGLLLYVLILV